MNVNALAVSGEALALLTVSVPTDVPLTGILVGATANVMVGAVAEVTVTSKVTGVVLLNALGEVYEIAPAGNVNVYNPGVVGAVSLTHRRLHCAEAGGVTPVNEPLVTEAALPPDT